MVNTEESTLGLSFISSLINSITLELGRDHWYDFGEQIKSSNVPAEFFNALAGITTETSTYRVKQVKDYIAVAERIFSKRFANPDEAMFAIHYCRAVSIAKIWEASHDNINEDYKVKTDLEEIKRLLSTVTSIYGCDLDGVAEKLDADQRFLPDQVALFRSIPEEMRKAEVAFENFDDRINAVNELRNTAISECGVVTQLKKYGVPPKLSDFVPWIKWQIAKLIGIRASEEDLEKVRLWVEEFFEKDQNRANVVLLSQG
jgi:hypothetical protein